jgi:protein gp37
VSLRSDIEWTESTWNPVTGCTKISAGCKNCYAERMAKRLKAMGNKNYKNGFQVTLHPHMLDKPFEWKKSQMVFVNSMSDLFHEEVPFEYIDRVFNVMRAAKKHTFQVLTKRAERLTELASHLEWPENIWMGVSVEDNDVRHRVELLRQVPAHIRFLSLEPLLGPLYDLDLRAIDWVIVGGESGPYSRPMNEKWVQSLRDNCLSESVPFFFKQWGGTNKKKAGRLLDGRTWDQMPVIGKRRKVA